ncbi:MAG: MBOAT family protein, partial [Muribaculaceae bacterium]|nr:MBOAT family protein [Muribaculaceae bacterium]
LLFTTLTSYATAILTTRSHPRLWTALNIAVNLAILLLFKYFNFFSDNLSRLLGAFGWNIDSFTIEVLLPIGISFYTFQAISYSVDVYRRTLAPERNIVTFSTYLSFFPQLLAGPIERGADIIPQLNRARQWDYDLACQGARETLWGLFKKVAIADCCGLIVTRIFSDSVDPDTWHLTVAAILFSIQIYCDFSGYCNIARGLAAMLGIRLMVNFRYPAFSRTPTDFWHRWHISLMSWFRDYIYIPLGGSRSGKWHTALNIMIVFTLSGIWHGASWNFVAWGVAWGAIMVLSRAIKVKRYPADNTPTTSARDMLRICLMGWITIMTFVLFRISDGLDHAWHIISHTWLTVALTMFAAWAGITLLSRLGHRVRAIVTIIALTAIAAVWVFAGGAVAIPVLIRLMLPVSIVALFAAEWHGRRDSFALEQLPARPVAARMAVYWILLLAIMLSNPTDTNFIYYQF